MKVCTQTESVCTQMYPSEKKYLLYQMYKKCQYTGMYPVHTRMYEKVCTQYILFASIIYQILYFFSWSMSMVHTSTYFRKKVCTTRYILEAKSMYQVHTLTSLYIVVPYYSMVRTVTYRYVLSTYQYILLVRIPDVSLRINLG